jgi:hypothetical protein
MKELIEKLVKWLEGLGQNWSDRVAFGSASEDTFPYLTFRQMPLANRERESSSKVIERMAWAFTLWHTDQMALLTQRDWLVKQFEELTKADIALITGEFVRADVQDRDIDEDPDRTDDGSIVWKSVIVVETLTRE